MQDQTSCTAGCTSTAVCPTAQQLQHGQVLARSDFATGHLKSGNSLRLMCAAVQLAAAAAVGWQSADSDPNAGFAV